MSISAAKLAPQAIVAAAVAYAVWPTIFAAPQKTDGALSAAEIEISADMLAGPASRPFRRDAFRLPGAAAPSGALSTKAAGEILGGKTLAESIAGLAAGDSLPDKLKEPSSAKQPADPLSGLVLTATCIAGERRLALINGQIYKADDIVDLPGTGDAPCRVSDIRAHDVVLEYQGRPLRLCYRDAPGASGAKAARAPAVAGNRRPPKLQELMSVLGTESGLKPAD